MLSIRFAHPLPVFLTLALGAALSGGCGSGTKAPPTIAQRLERARSAKTPEARCRELVRVARLQIDAGDRSGATGTLAEARRLIPAEGDPLLRGPRLIEVAAGYAGLGERSAARGLLEEVAALARAVDDPAGRVDLLASVAGGYGPAGAADADRAGAILTEARAATEEVSPRFRAGALAAVALAAVNSGRIDDASSLLDSLEQEGRALEEPRPRAEALAAAATVRAAGAGGADPEATRAVLAEAEQAARGIEGRESRVYGLAAVAEAAARAGDRRRAEGLLDLAEETVRRVPEPDAQRAARDRVQAARSALRQAG
jgi:hypothetical protein